MKLFLITILTIMTPLSYSKEIQKQMREDLILLSCDLEFKSTAGAREFTFDLKKKKCTGGQITSVDETSIFCTTTILKGVKGYSLSRYSGELLFHGLDESTKDDGFKLKCKKLDKIF